jgi:hypothetical protein
MGGWVEAEPGPAPSTAGRRARAGALLAPWELSRELRRGAAGATALRSTTLRIDSRFFLVPWYHGAGRSVSFTRSRRRVPGLDGATVAAR